MTRERSIAVAGVIGYATVKLIKTAGETGEEYIEATIDARDYAAETACLMNLKSIYTSLNTYTISTDGVFPESLRDAGISYSAHCPARQGPRYEYIPNQRASMSSDNVLAYDPNAVHDGKAGVLLLDGRTVMMTAEQLDQALEATKKRIAAGK